MSADVGFKRLYTPPPLRQGSIHTDGSIRAQNRVGI
jgi:hypothetical protein